MTAGGEDDVVQQIVEIIHLDKMFGNVDELRLVGQQAADQRHPEAFFPGGGQLQSLGR